MILCSPIPMLDVKSTSEVKRRHGLKKLNHNFGLNDNDKNYVIAG